jgi:hypothetical protein
MKLTKKTYIRNCLILALLFSSSACASFHTHEKIVDPQFEEFVEEFKKISGRKDSSDYDDMSIVFSKKNQGDGVIGTCHDAIFYREIEINEDFWTHSNYIDKQVLMNHELAHCVCNIGHSDPPSISEMSFFEKIYYKIRSWFVKDDNYFYDGCPKSWMNSTIVNSGCSYVHYSEYVKDIQNRCQP